MPKVKFIPLNIECEVPEGFKILASAIKNKVPIRFGCGACRCGTCGVAVDSSQATLSAMDEHEQALLSKMGLPINGTVRLACKTKVDAGEVVVDLDFQDTYSPDDGLEDEFDEAQ